MITEYVVHHVDERAAVLAMTDEELLDWLGCLRPKRILGTWFKRIPWSDDIIAVGEEATVGELRQQIRDATVGRRKDGMG